MPKNRRTPGRLQERRHRTGLLLHTDLGVGRFPGLELAVVLKFCSQAILCKVGHLKGCCNGSLGAIWFVIHFTHFTRGFVGL